MIKEKPSFLPDVHDLISQELSLPPFSAVLSLITNGKIAIQTIVFFLFFSSGNNYDLHLGIVAYSIC